MTVLPPQLAAGALCWRLVDGKARILVVHRGDRSDISLPKGKIEPGETLPETAVREIAEETGLSVTLGAPLGTVDYLLPSGRDKTVFYWSAEVDNHALELARFIPTNEITALEWLPIEDAYKRLTYEHDTEVVDRFAGRLAKGNARTFAIITVRHGKAVPSETWDGPDATRPLMQRGVDQSINIAKGIAAFGPEKIVTSTATRCVATVEPLSRRLAHLPIKATADISQDAYESDAAAVGKVVAKRIRKRRTAVLCSHGPVIPQIIDEIASLTRSRPDSGLRRASILSTGAFSVVHISIEHRTSGIVASETHGPNLA